MVDAGAEELDPAQARREFGQPVARPMADKDVGVLDQRVERRRIPLDGAARPLRGTNHLRIGTSRLDDSLLVIVEDQCRRDFHGI